MMAILRVRPVHDGCVISSHTTADDDSDDDDVADDSD